jgi:hypothetical protein
MEKIENFWKHTVGQQYQQTVVSLLTKQIMK